MAAGGLTWPASEAFRGRNATAPVPLFGQGWRGLNIRSIRFGAHKKISAAISSGAGVNRLFAAATGIPLAMPRLPSAIMQMTAAHATRCSLRDAPGLPRAGSRPRPWT